MMVIHKTLAENRIKTLRYTLIAIGLTAIGLATWRGILAHKFVALPNEYSVVPLSRGMNVLVAPSLELLSDLPVKRYLILENEVVVGEFGLGAALGPSHFSGQRPGYFFLDTRTGKMKAELSSQELKRLLLQNKAIECGSFPNCEHLHDL